MKLDAPDDITVRRLVDDPKLAMDTILRGINITRKLTQSDQGSRITSYGAPVETTTCTDRYGRKWQINVYLLEYADQAVITLSMPTPTGLSMIYKATDTATKDEWLFDLNKLTNFVNVSYSGTLEQWDTFLRQPDFHGAAMKGVSISYKEGSMVSVSTNSFSSTIPSGLVDVRKDSLLDLYCSVFLRHGAPVFDVRKLVFGPRNSSSSYYTFYRWSKPTDSLSKVIKDEWQRYPRCGSPLFRQGLHGRGSDAAWHPSPCLPGRYAPVGQRRFRLYAFRFQGRRCQRAGDDQVLPGFREGNADQGVARFTISACPHDEDRFLHVVTSSPMFQGSRARRIPSASEVSTPA